MIHIIRRICEGVLAFNGVPRPWGITDKKEVIRACDSSVLKVLVAYDQPELQSYGVDLSCVIDPGNLGNAGSLRQSFTLAKSICNSCPDDDIIFFLEDDYLFRPGNHLLALESFLHRYPTAVIHPSDYPDDYARSEIFNLFVHDNHHWRSTPTTTFTFACRTATILPHLNTAMSCGVDDGALSNYLKAQGIPMFSPVLGFCAHLHEGVMSPGVDWESIYRSNL